MRRESASDSSVAVAQPVLVWQRSSGSSIEFRVDRRQTFTIGRDATSNIMLPSTFVSRAHARFQYKNGKYLIEDLGSANGTKVNGAPVAVSVVVPGDTIELGDERLMFVDRATAPARPPATGAGKAIRLAAVAVVTLMAMGGALMMLRPRPPAAPPPSPAASRPVAAAPAPAGAADAATAQSPRPAAYPNSERVRQALQDAQSAGVSPVDALYDRGSIALRAGRLREATDLLTAVLERDPAHERARAALNEAQARIETGVAERLARADSLFAQFRFEEAILQWEQVGQLVDPNDPRATRAKEGIERARRARMSR